MATLNLVVSVAAVLCALCVLGSDGQRVRADCTKRDNFGLWYQDEDTPCSKEYEVCRSFVWRKSRCVLGHFDYATGQCKRFNAGSNCNINDNAFYFPNLRKKRDVSEVSEIEHRVKRQTQDCSTAEDYMCPQFVNEALVYPDWENLSCTSYMLCLKGNLLRGNCNGSYVFYNPRLMSCEEYPALSNTCVWREWADNTPFDGIKI